MIKEKLYKEASNLISDILDLKLGVGDIVEETTNNNKYTVLVFAYKECLLWSEKYGEQWYPKSHLKLKQKLITLQMVLEAIIIKDENTLIKEELSISEILIRNSELMALWILCKNNKDCSLFDQKNEKLYKFLINTLGESK